MNGKIDSHKLFRGLAQSALVLAVGGLIPLSAYAQAQNQQQASQDKAADVVATAEPSSTGTATLPAKTAVPDPPILPPSPGKWTGFYGGGHVGYGWGRADTTFTPLPTATQFINLAPTTLRPDPKGFIGGGQIGYNKQVNPWVFGAEFSISWSNMKGTAIRTPITQNTGATFNGTLTAHQDTKWFGTLRPRLGILPTSSRTWFLYGTGGWAFGKVNYSANSDFRPQGTIQYPTAFSQTKNGWTAGGGGEFRVAPHVSLNLEYLYYNLGNAAITANPTPANPPFQVAYNWETKAHIFNVSVNFH